MFSLLLTIFSSTSIALILKFNNTNKGKEIILISANYFTATLISILFMISENKVSVSLETFLFGMGLGSIFVFSFFAFAKAVEAAGTALATVSSRLSVIVSMSLSIIIYNEIPNYIQVIGFVAAFTALYFFYKSLTFGRERKLEVIQFFYLAVVLVGIGLVDFFLKVFNQWRPHEEKSFFLLSIFGSALVYSLIYIFTKKVKFEKRTVATGLVLGIPNVFSSFFLIDALKQIPAIIVFPSLNIGVIILTTISAYVFWKEKLNNFGKIALLIGLISIGLLSI